MPISSALGSSALLPAGLGFRNLLINGDMRVNQRAISSTTDNGEYVVDRWRAWNGAGTVSFQQSTTAPTGFSKSLSATVISTSSYGSAGYTNILYRIEGNDCQNLAWGSASPKPIVLSFWCRSSVIGTYSCQVTNSASNRSYVATFLINTANAWEYKQLYINGDSSGTWLTGNNIGVQLLFGLGAGTNYDTPTPNVWINGNYNSVSSCVDFSTNAGATFYITGVQMEQNTQPTPFEQRPIGVELALCQRYFHVIPAGNIKAVNQYATVGLSGGNLLVSHSFPVTMRTEPTVYTSAGSGSHSFDFYQSSAGTGISRVLVYQSGQSTTTIGFKTLAYSSDNNGGNVIPSNGHLIGILNTAVWVSAEL